MKYNIATVPGDGIGPDIVEQAILVLNKIGEKYDHEFLFTETLAGGIAIDKTGMPLPQETIDICKKSDSVLLGAVGGPKWDNLEGAQRPEKALLGLRSALGLFANIRPAILHEALKDACPLKPEVIGDSLDLVVVRELTGGIYFGERNTEVKEGEEVAYDTMIYSESEVERIAKTAFELAMKRNKKLTSVDKSNILDNSRLWRKTVEKVAEQYPEVELKHLYVDNAAMQLIINPKQFDVILTGNMFGDILSDEASMMTGSIGMLPSASLNESKLGLYEPIHGSAPDIAGLDKANPIATILSVAMMLRYSLDLSKEADNIENAVTSVLNSGYRTGDIMSEGKTLVGTQKMGELIVEAL